MTAQISLITKSLYKVRIATGDFLKVIIIVMNLVYDRASARFVDKVYLARLSYNYR